MKKEELQVFSNDDFGEVIVLMREDKPWFISKEISVKLGYSDTDKMTRRLDEDEIIKLTYKECVEVFQSTYAGDSKINNNGMSFINESGFYNAVLGSKLPQAKKFKKWVTNEVLPSIRKHGAYMTDNTLEKALTDPDFLIQLATQLKDEKQKRIAAEKKYSDAKPKIDFADKVEFSKANITMKEFSDLLNIKNFGRNKMMEYLRNKGYLNKKNEPYRQYIEQGIFETKERPIILGDGKEIIQITTYITGKGQTYLNKKILEDIAS